MQTVAEHSQGDYCSSSESKKSEKINQKGALSAVYRAERVSQPKILECLALSALWTALSATCNLQKKIFCTRPPVYDVFMPKSDPYSLTLIPMLMYAMLCMNMYRNAS